jgi:hypothetical protein
MFCCGFVGENAMILVDALYVEKLPWRVSALSVIDTIKNIFVRLLKPRNPIIFFLILEMGKSKAGISKLLNFPNKT